ncbi:MAG: cyclic-di-AMP receptor [Anaerolineae bacterium]
MEGLSSETIFIALLFIAVEDNGLEKVLAIIHGGCHSQVMVECTEPSEPLSPGPAPVGARVGGAVVFVWDLEHFEVY